MEACQIVVNSLELFANLSLLLEHWSVRCSCVSIVGSTWYSLALIYYILLFYLIYLERKWKLVK